MREHDGHRALADGAGDALGRPLADVARCEEPRHARLKSERVVEIIDKGVAAWNAGDMSALRQLWAPGAVMLPPEGWPEPGPFIGRDAIFRQFEQMRDTWSADTVDPIEGPFGVDDYVVLRFSWRGASHGLDVDMELTVVYRFREDKVIAAEFFWDHDQAMAAAAAQDAARST